MTDEPYDDVEQFGAGHPHVRRRVDVSIANLRRLYAARETSAEDYAAWADAWMRAAEGMLAEPKDRLCQCELSGEIEVLIDGKGCEIHDEGDGAPISRTQVAAALKFYQERVAAVGAMAREEEREACAKIVLTAGWHDGPNLRDALARAIRARSKPAPSAVNPITMMDSFDD